MGALRRAEAFPPAPLKGDNMNKIRTIGAVIGLAAAMPALAAIPDAAGVIHACYNLVNGSLRVIDPASGSCRTGEAPLQWGVQGAPGAPGPTGPAGPPGIALAWAHVRADGTMDQDSGNITVIKVHDGGYCVGVSGGTVSNAVATIDSLPNMSGAVQVGVFAASVCPENARQVYVVTRLNAASGGLPGQDRAFYLLVN
jgi:hypothetical protein